MEGLRAVVLFVLFSTTVSPGVSLTQEDVNHVGQNLNINYEVVDNFIDSWKQYKARVTLKNNGNITIATGNWAIYFCSIRIVEPDHLSLTKRGYVVPGGTGIKLYHINGCLHKMEPTDEFKDLKPGNELSVEFKVKYFSVARTDVMPNWYIAAPGLQPRVINNTSGEDLTWVTDFIAPRQYKRQRDDLYHPYSPLERYDMVDIKDLGKAQLLIVPTPLHVENYNLTLPRVKINGSGWRIHRVGNELSSEASYLSEKLNIPVITYSPPKQAKIIKLSIANPPDILVDGKKSTSDERYMVMIQQNGPLVQILAPSRHGVFNGIQTLLGLADKDTKVPIVTIKDAPRFAFRGMHLDVGRNFHPKETVKKLLDLMATYKLNKFHFHLSEDEAWRLEIDGLDELTQIGSKRCHDLDERKCLIPQLGSDPNGSGTKGYYSKIDYDEILRYASRRHIQVIPEFDMPGHSHAAIKSMEARYHKKKSAGEDAKARQYLLIELGDPSKYISVQWFKDNAINPCIESTYTFITHVVKKLKELHPSVQPLTMYHFGGDEVAHGAWMNSTECRKLTNRMGFNFTVDNLKDYFVQRVSNITRDLILGGWEDGLLGPGFEPYLRSRMWNRDVYAYAWRGGGQRAHNLANAGYKVILAQATHLYFDHPYEPDPEERGYYWAARYTDTRKTFSYTAEDLYSNVKVTRWGKPITKDELCKEKKDCPELKAKDNIVGMLAGLWTETIRTADQLDSMVFPRLLALAERAWHKASWEVIRDKNDKEREMKEDWEKFANFLGYKELARLDRAGVKYHIPVPGARLEGGLLKTKTVLPGLTVQYSADGGVTWRDITDSTRLNGNVKLATRSADGTRLSRPVNFFVSASGVNTSPFNSFYAVIGWLTLMILQGL